MEVNSIPIPKGLQKDVLFKGLKAKYIGHCLYVGLAAVILGMILSTFIPMILAIGVITILLSITFLIFLFYSKTYGANGFLKKMADAAKPDEIIVSTSIENLLLWRND